VGTVPTALQRHVGFFDPEGTGVVTMRQTRAAMRRLGVRWTWRVILPPVIHGFLGYLTQRRVSFVIDVARIAQGKHPFDSGVFDATGDQDPTAFEALFANAGEAITADEMRAIILARGNRLPAMGKLAGVLGRWFSAKEIRLFFCVASDATKTVGGRPMPAVTRRTLRAFYDGTLLPALARRRVLVVAGCVVPRVPGSV
jgi:Caleosin related protein